jgi:hypothetical protein
MRVCLTLLVYAVAIALCAAVSFVVVMLLAGPHTGLLPRWAEAAVLCIGWANVIIVPVLAARWTWRRQPGHASR